MYDTLSPGLCLVLCEDIGTVGHFILCCVPSTSCMMHSPVVILAAAEQGLQVTSCLPHSRAFEQVLQASSSHTLETAMQPCKGNYFPFVPEMRFIFQDHRGYYKGLLQKNIYIPTFIAALGMMAKTQNHRRNSGLHVKVLQWSMADVPCGSQEPAGR